MIGFWDLFIHFIALCTLIVMFRQTPRGIEEMPSIDDQRASPADPSASNRIMSETNLFSRNVLLNRILEKRNVTHIPMGWNSRNFYSNADLATIKWAASLNQRTLVFSNIARIK
jgi:hypothetical protein